LLQIIINVATVLTFILGTLLSLIAIVVTSKLYRKMPIATLSKQIFGTLLLCTMIFLTYFGCQLYIRIFLQNIQIQWIIFLLPTLLYFALSTFQIFNRFIVNRFFGGDFTAEFMSSIVYQFFYICTTRYLYTHN
jgi:hypothetical protein